jgi:hypothetical protein
LPAAQYAKDGMSGDSSAQARVIRSDVVDRRSLRRSRVTIVMALTSIGARSLLRRPRKAR